VTCDKGFYERVLGKRGGEREGRGGGGAWEGRGVGRLMDDGSKSEVSPRRI